MGYTIIYRRYRNRVAEMLRGFLFVRRIGMTKPPVKLGVGKNS